MMKIDASIVISTKDRASDLLRALQSATSQIGSPEIIVIDDGSSDETPNIVRKFSEIRYIRHEQSAGLIVRRNQGAVLATGSIIISIDDDAEFSDENCAARICGSFAHPKIAAVAVPCIEPRKANRLFQIPPSDDGIFVTDSFMGTAHALRRDVFLEIGGFRESLIRQGEERDLSIRLMTRGYFVGYAKSPPIIHYEQPQRNWAIQGYFGRRNDVLFAVHVAPSPMMFAHLIGTTINGLIFALKTTPRLPMVKGLLSGWAAIPKALTERTPATLPVYRLARNLKKQGPLPLHEALRQLGYST